MLRAVALLLAAAMSFPAYAQRDATAGADPGERRFAIESLSLSLSESGSGGWPSRSPSMPRCGRWPGGWSTISPPSASG